MDVSHLLFFVTNPKEGINDFGKVEKNIEKLQLRLLLCKVGGFLLSLCSTFKSLFQNFGEVLVNNVHQSTVQSIGLLVCQS